MTVSQSEGGMKIRSGRREVKCYRRRSPWWLALVAARRSPRRKTARFCGICPLDFTWKYDRGVVQLLEDGSQGKTFEPALKSQPPGFGMGYKKRVYSPNRIAFPLKRVDWGSEWREKPPRTEALASLSASRGKRPLTSS